MKPAKLKSTLQRIPGSGARARRISFDLATSQESTAQVAYQEGCYLASHLNDISNKEGKPFEYISKGQICYTGQGKSVYQYTPNFYFSGIFCGYMNKVVHVYNSINIEQMLSFLI